MDVAQPRCHDRQSPLCGAHYPTAWVCSSPRPQSSRVADHIAGVGHPRAISHLGCPLPPHGRPADRASVEMVSSRPVFSPPPRGCKMCAPPLVCPSAMITTLGSARGRSAGRTSHGESAGLAHAPRPPHGALCHCERSPEERVDHTEAGWVTVTVAAGLIACCVFLIWYVLPWVLLAVVGGALVRARVLQRLRDRRGAQVSHEAGRGDDDG